MEKKREPNKKHDQDNINLLLMSQNKGKAETTTPGKTPGELEDDRWGQDYMIMEVSEHTKQNLIPNCFGVYRPT